MSFLSPTDTVKAPPDHAGRTRCARPDAGMAESIHITNEIAISEHDPQFENSTGARRGPDRLERKPAGA